jgi:hypothetical protein
MVAEPSFLLRNNYAEPMDEGMAQVIALLLYRPEVNTRLFALTPDQASVVEETYRLKMIFNLRSTIADSLSEFEAYADPHQDPSAVYNRIHAKYLGVEMHDAAENPSAGMRSLDESSRRAYALLASSTTRDAFDLSKEPQKVRERFGPTPFAQNCLLARRLVEAGVPFVRVGRAWWDSHGQNFETHAEMVPELDHVMATLLDDLEQRGLLRNTLVVTLAEFGRTPSINARNSCVICSSSLFARSCAIRSSDGANRAITERARMSTTITPSEGDYEEQIKKQIHPQTVLEFV